MKEREGGGERAVSFLRHDFSEDTAACCGYWEAVKKLGENESERGHEGGNGGEEARADPWLGS